MLMSVGEALVGSGNEVAHIDLLIGSKEGPSAWPLPTLWPTRKAVIPT